MPSSIKSNVGIGVSMEDQQGVSVAKAERVKGGGKAVIGVKE